MVHFSKLIADIDPERLSAGVYGRGAKHARKVPTAYAKYVGRVGALAVSLGVGIAVATSPGIAAADAEDAESASAAPDSDPAPETADAEASIDAPAPTTAGGSSAAPEGVEASGGPPAMNVDSSGGLHDSTYGTVGEIPIDDEEEQEEEQSPDREPVSDLASEEEAEVPTPEMPVDEQLPLDPPAAPSPETPGGEEPAVSTGNPNDETSASSQDSIAVDGAGATDSVVGNDAEPYTFSTVTAASHPPESREAPANVLSAEPLAETVAFNPVSAIMAIPNTLVSIASVAVAAILGPFLVPGPAAPPQMPLLWAVLAWVRREITHTFFNRTPRANPEQSVQLVPGLVTGDLNAYDPNGDPLEFTVKQQPQYGSVIVNADGTYTYTRDAQYLLSDAPDSFTVAINDSVGTHLPGVFGLIQGVFECAARVVGIAQPDTRVVSVPVGIDVLPSLVGPVVVASPVAPTYTLGGTSSAVGSAVVSVSDLDSSVLTGATVKIGAGATTGDTLSFNNTAKISGQWNAANFTLTLTGVASADEYETALQSVTFTANSLGTVARTVSFSATDGSLVGLPAITAVTVLPALVGPLVVALPVAPPHFLGGTASAVGSAVVSVSDSDSSVLTGATVKIGAGAVPGDTLSFNDTPKIVGYWDADNFTLTLVGDASAEEYEAALQSVTFTSESLGLVARSVIFTASDGALVSVPGVTTVVVLPAVVNAAPVVVVLPAAGTASAGGAVLPVGNVVVSVSDVGSGLLSGATVTIDPLTLTAGDELDFTGTAMISGSYAGGVLTLTGDAPVAEYQQVLESVTFRAAGAGLVARTVSFVVADDQGAVSVPGVTTVVVLPDLLPPVVTTSLINLAPYTAGDTALVLDPNVSIVDLDSTNITGATVTIASGFVVGDTLEYAIPTGSGLTGDYDAGSGVLTFSGDATADVYEQVLRSITYSTDTTALAAVKTLTYEVVDDQDQTGVSLPLTLTVVAFPNVAPVVVTSLVGVQAEVLSLNPININPLIVVTDLNSTHLSGATVSITSGLKANDELTFTAPTGSQITGAYSSGVLTLEGEGTVAEYQQALRSVTFSTTGGLLTLGLRTFSIVAIDDQQASSVPGTVAFTVVSLL